MWPCIQIVLQTRSGLPSRASVAVVYEDGKLSVRLWIMDNGGVVTSVIMLLNIQSDYNANVSQGFLFFKSELIVLHIRKIKVRSGN